MPTDKEIEQAEDSIIHSVNVIEDQLNEIRNVTGTPQPKTSKGKGKREIPGVKTGKQVAQTWTFSTFIWILGALSGILIAAYYGTNHIKETGGFTELEKTFSKFDNLQPFFDDLKLSMPENLQTLINNFQNETPDLTASFVVGKNLKAEHSLSPKYPVIMIPGVTSTGLESWGLTETGECPSVLHFRKRLWGSMYMIKTMLLDKACWLKHVMLDTETGLDPEGFILRASEGFESTDYFMAGYWIWNKILENLSAIGYEPNKMITASYDWRLAYLDLERRDSYFTKLKQSIELRYHQTNGEKSVLIGHSMGSQIGYYFMKWVEAEGVHFGNGGPDWVNKYIGAYVDIAGSVLGAPKAMPALLSGEMKDTVQLNPLAVYGLEKFFSRRERLDMIRSFAGIPGMLPKGGDLIWGNYSSSYEDRLQNHTSSDASFGNFIRFEQDIGIFSRKNLSMSDSIDYLLDTASPDWFIKRTKENYSYGVAKTPEELVLNNQDHSKWSNPLEAPLPNAPDLKIFCFYGVGNPTERAYIYKEEDEEEKSISRVNISIKQSYDDPTVFFTDGDGTVPLMTHSMCHKWKTSKSYNPGGSLVKVVEIKHEPDRFDIRGGAKTADHVDILGSAELNELVLKVASGRDDLIEERFITNLTHWVDEMDFGFD